MLARATSHGVRHPRRTAVLALLLVLFAAVVGGPVASKLNARNAFEDPSSQSATARTRIERATGVESSAGVIALVHAAPLSVATAAAARTLSRDPAVAHVSSYADTHDPALVSEDGRSTLLDASLYAGAEPNAAVDRLTRDFAASRDVLLGGPDVAGARSARRRRKDLGFAELLAFPLLALLALLIFRGVAALLPVARRRHQRARLVRRAAPVNEQLPLSSVRAEPRDRPRPGPRGRLQPAARLALSRGAGRRAPTSRGASRRSRTAGRTIIFSALTVAAAMLTLIVFPHALPALDGHRRRGRRAGRRAASLLLLPALFVLLGRRLGAPCSRRPRGPAAGTAWPAASCAGRRSSPPARRRAAPGRARRRCTSDWTGVDALGPAGEPERARRRRRARPRVPAAGSTPDR